MSFSVEKTLRKIKSARGKRKTSLGCFVCGKENPKWKRENDSSGIRLCSDLCNQSEYWFSHFFPLHTKGDDDDDGGGGNGGMKRARQQSIISETSFQDLPPEIQAYIILMALDYRIENYTEWKRLRKLMKQSQHYPNFIQMLTEEVFPRIQYVTPKVFLRDSKSLQRIAMFTGLIRFEIPALENEINFTPILKEMRHLKLLSIWQDTGIDLDLRKLTQIDSLVCGPDHGDDDLINGLTNLTFLSLSDTSMISDVSLTTLVNLSELHLVNYHGWSDTMKITNEGLIKLPSLTSLSLHKNLQAHNTLIQNLTQLTEIDIEGSRIRDQGIQDMTNLIRLNAHHMTITGDVLMRMTKLESLDVGFDDYVSNESIGSLVNLTKLNISGSYHRMDQLSKLTNLNSLILHANKGTFDRDIKNLVSLTNLDVYLTSDRITNEGIENLINMKHLNIALNDKITTDAMINMVALRTITIDKNQSRNGRWERNYKLPSNVEIIVSK